jgi:PAS domain S-box-containing protein
MMIFAFLLVFAFLMIGAGLWLVLKRYRLTREDLESSSAKYEMLFDRASEAIFHADARGVYMNANRRASEIFGYSTREFLGMTMTDLIDPTDLAERPIQMARLMAGEIVTSERLLVRKDGSRIQCEISGRRMPDGTFLGIVRDVTSRKKEDELLRKNEERYRLLLERGMDLIAIVDADGTVTYQSPSIQAVMGYRQEEFLGRDLREFVPEHHRNAFDALLQSVVANPGKVHHSAAKAIRKDGKEIVLEGSMINLLDVPAIRGIVLNGRDITARVHAEKQLQRAADDMTSVFNVIPSAVCMTDLEGRILSLNIVARRYLNGTGISESLEGKRYCDVMEQNRLLSPEEVAAFRDGFMALVQHREKLFSTVVAHETLLGKIWWQVQATRVEMSTPAVLIVHHDITERKRIEERLAAQERMLRNVIDSEPECVKILARDGTLLDMNQAGMRILDGDRTDIVGKNMLDFVPSHHHERLTDALADAFAGKTVKVEFDIMGLTGIRRMMESSCVPLRNEIGEVDTVLSVSRDVTEHHHALAALQMSEERFRRVFETATDIIYTCTLDGRIDSLNPAFEDVLGQTREEWIGREFRDLVHPDDVEIAQRAFEQCLHGTLPGQFELRVRHVNGSYRIGEFRSAPMFIGGNVSGIVGISRDVTERKEKDRRLLESEERYRSLFEEELTAKFISVPSGRILACNAAFARMFGYSSNDAVLSSDATGLYETSAERERFLNLIRERGALYYHESDLRRIDGRLIHVIENVIGKFDDNGELIEIHGSLIDVTDQRIAQRRILDQSQYLDQAQDGIVVTNMDRQIIYWNKSAERLFGWSAAETLGSDIQHLLFLNRDSKIDRVYQDVLTRDDVQEEWEIAGKDGTKAIFQSRWSVVRDDRGVAKSVISIHSDITEKKRIESQFLRAQRLESVGVLASGIAHDLNNILSAVGLATHLLKKKYANEQAAELLATVESSVQRGADIVKQVLLFTRGTDGERKPLNANELIGEMTRIVKETFPKSIELCTTVDPDLWTVYGDRTQLHQVLMNLCVNARDAMPSGGTLVLSAHNHHVDEAYARMHVDAHPGRYVTIDVRDTGTGIPPDVVDRIFDPFFTTKELGKGTGLGLSTVLGIVKSHGGFIRVYSEPGRGTKFSIHLPINDEPQEIVPTPSFTDLRGQGEMILLVDDEKPVRQIAHTALEENGYRVLSAENGADAIAILADHKSDIRAVVLDMMMPVMDGWMTAQAIAKMAPSLPVIATSGFQDRWGERRPENIIELIEKPYAAERLLTSLRAVLDERAVMV